MFRTVATLALLIGPSVASAGYAVSSFKKETRLGSNYWNAASALDGKGETCWRVDPEGDNKGQWIEIDVPLGKVDKIGVVIGWDKDEPTFKDYARIKTGTVEVFDLQNDNKKVLSHPVSFEDKRGWQVIDLPDTKVGGEIQGGRVRLTIDDVYAGQDYPSLAVSDVLIYMQEFDAVNTAIAAPPSEAVPGHEGVKLLDGNSRTFWASDKAEGQVTLSAKGYGVSSIGITSGPKPYARPKTVELTAGDTTITHVLADQSSEQWVRLPALIGYTGSAWGDVTLKVIDTYPSTGGKGLAISELKLKATNVEDF